MRFTPIIFALLTTVGCGLTTTNEPKGSEAPWSDSPATDPYEKPEDAQPNEAWGSSDDPTLFSDELDFKLDSLPLSGEATNIPWAGSYWPVYKDSINMKWDGAESLSPAAKYGKAFGVEEIEKKVSYTHGVEKYKNRTACKETSECDSTKGESCAIRDGEEAGYCIPTWWGICHAWAPVAILEPEPVNPVTRNGVEFKVNDIKALATLAYNRTSSRFVSLRCNENEEADEIEYDEYDRPTGEDEECRDTNPGTYHVLLANFLGLKGESFIEDRTFDDEVWNQPLRSYEITSMENITIERAHELIGVPDTVEDADEMPRNGTTELSGTVANKNWEHHEAIMVAEGANIEVDMTGLGEGDADLYVAFGDQPTADDFACRPYRPGSNEACSLEVPQGETRLYISVHEYSTKSTEYEIVVDIDGIDTGEEGNTAVEYVFNEDAAELYHVKLNVKYITESNATTDGNLADRIDRYTRTDRYQYVLEVNDNGEIIGGEWIGSSKRNHPDFLWLPTERSNWPVPASGSIQWDLVKDLIDSSQPEEVPEISGTPERVEETVELEKDEWAHFGPYTVGGTLEATISGTGDADLYVNRDTQPSKTSYECRPYRPSSNEQCTLAGGGTFYVSVHGYSSSTAELNISFTDEDAGDDADEDPTEHLNEDSSVSFYDMALYVLEVHEGQRVIVQSTSSNDVDLYVRMDDPPTTAAYDARAYTYSGNETIEYTAPSAGILHIGVHGWEAADFILVTSDG